MGEALVLGGAALVIVWGVAHAMPVRTVVAGFHLSGVDQRRILTMEWLAEALALVFVGALALVVTALGSGPTVPLVQRIAGGVLLAMAALHALLGARTSIRPMQICPVVLTTAALLVLAGSAL